MPALEFQIQNTCYTDSFIISHKTSECYFEVRQALFQTPTVVSCVKYIQFITVPIHTGTLFIVSR